MRLVVADGRRLPFADGEFDIAVSNAVVEHVGDADDQRAFVHELCRVGQQVFVSTPNRWFPIEGHTLLPFVHYAVLGALQHLFYRLGGSRRFVRVLQLMNEHPLARVGQAVAACLREHLHSAEAVAQPVHSPYDQARYETFVNAFVELAHRTIRAYGSRL